jgi:hypothetical protein
LALIRTILAQAARAAYRNRHGLSRTSRAELPPSRSAGARSSGPRARRPAR